MAKINKFNGGCCVNVDMYMTDAEFAMLEAFRARSEEYMRKSPYCEFKDGDQYTLDDAVNYIVNEVLAGRGEYFNLLHCFSD